MFESKHKKTSKNILCKILSLIAGIAVSSIVFAKLSGSLAPEAIAERIKPVGEVHIEGGLKKEAKPKIAAGPESIYKNNCSVCHQSGLAGAPKKGNKKDWQPRIDQGKDLLIKHTINGIRAMPPKGNCASCTEDDLKSAIEYMAGTKIW